MFSNTSSSEIISQIISVNKDEFTNNVQEIINQEMVKLSNKINSTVEETIKKKISEFYNLNFDYEDLLFDKEIDSLAKLAKLVEAESLLDSLKDKTKFDDLSEEELLLLYNFRNRRKISFYFTI